MKVECHKRAVKESLEEISDAIRKGVSERQRTIGFHCSVAAADMLEIFLHEKGLVDPGATIKHDFFSSGKKASERIPSFSNKSEILSMLVELESKRNVLCYGKPQPVEAIEEYIRTFNKIRKLFDSMGVAYE